MNIKKMMLAAVCLAALGAVHPQDNADSAQIIKRLPASTTTIHARRLPVEEFDSLTNLPKLVNLHFSRGFGAFPAKVTDAGLAKLVSLNLRSLRHIDLGFCTNITDAGLVDVARMDWLTGLSIIACPKITDKGLQTLASMTNLTLLNLKGSPQITERSLDILAARTNWREIMLGGCSGISPGALGRVQAKLPGTKVVKDERNWNQVYGQFLK